MKIGFQEENVKWLVGQYCAGYRRLLLADETGLGKTYSAAGVIYELADKKKNTKKTPRGERLRVLYLCSNQLIARKNMGELAEKLLELDKDKKNKLLKPVDAKQYARSFGDRLSIPEQKNQGSYIYLRNATVETTFETYHNVKPSKAELDKISSNGGNDSDYVKDRIKAIKDNIQKTPFDLIVVDEFQSYEQILDKSFPPPSTDAEVTRLFLNELFPDTKMLLLSATPYRMDTKALNAAEKLMDLQRILSFLAVGSKNKTRLVENYCAYRDALLSSEADMNCLQAHKEEFEQEFQKFCRRNQRVHAMTENDFYSPPVEHGSADTPEALRGEAEMMRLYAEVLQDEAGGEESEESPRRFSPSYVRKCPYPAAFSKGYKAWEEKTYINKPELYPAINTPDQSTMPGCKYALCGNGAESGNICERNIRLDGLCFPNNSALAACAQRILQNEAGEAIYQCAWLPPSHPNHKLEPPFSTLIEHNAASKLLVFTRRMTEERYLAAAISAKACCDDRNKIETARKVIENLKPDSYLGECCKKACEGKEVVGEYVFYRMQEYFLREPVLHVLARAGIDSVEKFQEYLYAGDFTATLEEYFFQIGFCPDETGAKVQNYIAKNKISSNMTDRIKDLLLAELYNAENQNAKDLLFEGDLCDARKTIGAARIYLGLCSTDQDMRDKTEDNVRKLYYGCNSDMGDLFSLLHAGANGGPEQYKYYRDHIRHIIDPQRPDAGMKDRIDTADFEKALRDFLENQIEIVASAYGENYNINESKRNSVKAKYWAGGSTDNKPLDVCASELQKCLTLNPSGLLDYGKKLRGALESMSDTFSLFPEQHVCVGYRADDSGRVCCARMLTGFACRFTQAMQDSEDHNETAQTEMMQAFNSPFFPFLLAASDIAKEGISFHSYCRKLLHAYIPEQPAVLIQRNGRIDRFHSLAIRQRAVQEWEKEWPGWEKLFEDLPGDKSGMSPHWYIKSEQGPKTEEHVFCATASPDFFRMRNLYNDVVFYKQMIGSCLPNEILDDLRIRYGEEAVKRFNLNLTGTNGVE